MRSRRCSSNSRRAIRLRWAGILTNGRNMQFLRNMNLINPISALADGRPVFSTAVNANTRLYPQFNNITLIDTGSNSSYNALTATYEHRMSFGWTLSASSHGRMRSATRRRATATSSRRGLRT